MFNIFYSLCIKRTVIQYHLHGRNNHPKAAITGGTSTVLVQGHPIKLGFKLCFPSGKAAVSGTGRFPTDCFMMTVDAVLEEFYAFPQEQAVTVGEMISPLLIIITGSQHANAF